MTSLRLGPARPLVADDNKVNRLLLARSLELQGHSVVSATDGKAALAMLAEDGFDLLLLDMEMPEMNGFQVLERLNADRVLRDLPAIVTPSLEGIANVVRCIGLGNEDDLPKRVNPVLLKARIGAGLEAHTKACGHAVLIDAAMASALSEGDFVERLGDAQFHGIAAPVEVYAEA